MRIEYHRSLLADAPRNAAFKAALAEVIVPGVTTVADIGAGTGVLGLLAAKLGAKRVTLYESAGVLEIAEQIRHLNRIDNVELVAIHSTDVIDPPRVDVVISETLGNYPFEENIIQTLKDAKRRFLKRDGVMIPARVTQYVCPVTSRRFFDELTVWDRTGLDLDFAPARTMSLNNIYVRNFATGDLLGNGETAAIWDELDFAKSPSVSRKGRAQWHFIETATVYGLAIWWQAALTSKVAISTSPLGPTTHWEQLYLPLLQPLDIMTGERLEAEISSKSSVESGTTVAWSLARADQHGRVLARQAMDLEQGYLP